MKLFHITHPDGVDDLPAGFASWALAWDATEQQAQQEKEEEASRRGS